MDSKRSLSLPLASVFLALGCASAAFAADGISGACGLPGVVFRGADETEARSGCEGLSRILKVFEGMKAPVEPRFTLVFESEVLTPQEKIPVYGYFDPESREIHMLHFHAEGQREREPWGIPWNDEIAASFLLHEITHLVVISYMGADYRRLPHAWHEALAYSMQFRLMGEELRGRIFAQGSELGGKPLSDRDSVNDMIYGFDPESFATRSYLSIEEWGGLTFFKAVMDSKI